MPEIDVYQFPTTGQQIRTVIRDGEPWFVAADICAAVEVANVSQTVSYLDDDERATLTTNEGRPLNVVSEPGLYSLILRSRKPEAKAFKRWITHDVLPAIRQTGRYEMAALDDPLAEIEAANQRSMRAVTIAKQERAARLVAEQRAAELEPDAARARKTMDAVGLSLVRAVAKRFGIKERALREFLYAEHLLIRTGTSRNEPYARFVQSGHFEVKTTMVEVDPDRPAQTRSTTYVTPKGEALIWKRLFDAGYVASPTMPPVQLELTAA